MARQDHDDVASDGSAYESKLNMQLNGSVKLILPILLNAPRAFARGQRAPNKPLPCN
jgi:hypothetical protein